MKTLKQIMGDLGGYQPKPEGEQNFVKKHVVDKKEDMNGNGDDVFKAAKVKTADRPGERHGYTDADDDKAANITVTITGAGTLLLGVAKSSSVNGLEQP